VRIDLQRSYMTRDYSQWVTNLFAASTSDWTPVQSDNTVRVMYAPVSSDPEASSRCASVLSASELERAERFVTDDNRANFIQRRAFRRYCGALAIGAACPLSRIIFQETANGRPYLSDLPTVCFSFSSCRFGFLGAWSSTHQIGVDLEDQTRILEAIELAQQFFSRVEEMAVKAVGGPARLRSFYQLWSLKEAALKSIGEGLPFGVDSFEFELGPTLRVVRVPSNFSGPERFQAKIIERTDICAALVIRTLA
jgi:phosphopantetheinyl transferase